MMKVEFFRHNLGFEEKEAVCRILDSVFLTTGGEVCQFENSLATYLGAKHCVALTSCTAALHLSLLALGIGSGDEVITTPMTFVASSLAIIHTGAKPVWVDVELDTGNIDAGQIEAAVTSRTKAIMPVHLYGQMCDMKKIWKIADKYDLRIIEDCAHALESERDGIKAGQVSDAACFSFYATKSITSGEGGAVTTNSEELADKIRKLRMHGLNKEAADRYTSRYQHWDLEEIGWKYNMDNIQAALLRPQLRKVERYWRRRKEIRELYRQALESLPDVQMPSVRRDSKSGYHLFTIWVSPELRDATIGKLQDRDIGVAVNYRAIHLLSKFRELFGKERGSYHNAERIGDSTISLPFYPSLSENEIEYVIDQLRTILGK